MTPAAAKYALGDFVEKIRGSKWRGKVVGFYETKNTLVGYVVESWFEPGSVQVWPEAALRPWTPPDTTAADEALEKAREALKAFLHLVTPGPDNEGRDVLDELPDSHQFELVWCHQVEDYSNAPDKQFQDPTITAGQMRRAREALAAIDAAKAKGGE